MCTDASRRFGQQWSLRWLLNLLASILVGTLGLPFVRAQPAPIHNFVLMLPEWQQRLFLFVLCVAVTSLFCRLLAPEAAHLRYVWSRPPLWLAWLLGFIVVAALDLSLGLSPKTYLATLTDWCIYGAGPLLLVLFIRSRAAFLSTLGTQDNELSVAKHSFDPNDWQALESWLRTDDPAEFDFLGHFAVAERTKHLLNSGTRSIGIVGPFGAGKTSIIEWLTRLSEENPAGSSHLLISRHGCWGFDDSASAIHAMLTDGLAKVGQQIDTFHIMSLPEAYRQSISSAGDWIDGVSRLIFSERDPADKFAALSALLLDINARLVFVVEDLDRNDSRSFDIQEVLAFLQQLKEFPRLSFVLTGGIARASGIDFGKLCDHIEYLKLVKRYCNKLWMKNFRRRLVWV